ncbi:hypothetical protein BDQ17DRAFT_1423991 [Cyathus striatus]|nr:hypothetical protein BDQ17DRAFT_1423991 [Cyathus striatus]
MSTTTLPSHLKDIGPPPGLCPIPLHKPRRRDSLFDSTISRRSSVSSWTNSSRSIDTPSPLPGDTTFRSAPFGHTKDYDESEFISQLYAHVDTNSAHQSKQPSVFSTLDVRAPAFIPKAIRPSVPNFRRDYDLAPDLTPPPPIPETPEMTHMRLPLWYPCLIAGSVSLDADTRERYALDLVHSVETIWDSNNVRELTQYFCLQAMESSSDRYRLALLAWKIHKIFNRIPGSDVPLLFLQHLENEVFGHFIYRWDNGISQNLDDEYVSSSLRLSEFIGRLFAQDMLSRAATKNALAALFEGGLYCLARIQAAELILYNLTPQFWLGFEKQVYGVSKYLYIEKMDLRIENPLYRRKLESRIEDLMLYLLNNRSETSRTTLSYNEVLTTDRILIL